MPGGWRGAERSRLGRLPPDWRTTTRRILARDGGVCHVCGEYGANEVDHIVAGDDHRLSNLAAIHGYPCHRRKTAREANAARWRNKARREPEKHPGLK